MIDLIAALINIPFAENINLIKFPVIDQANHLVLIFFKLSFVFIK